MSSSRKMSPKASPSRVAKLVERLQSDFLDGIHQTPNRFEVSVDIKGYKEDDISVTIKNVLLVIAGFNGQEEDITGPPSLYREFPVPDNVDKHCMRTFLDQDEHTLYVGAPYKKEILNDF